MKNTKLILLAGTALGLALSLGACEQKKSDDTPSSVGTSQAPAPEKSTPDQSSTSPSGSDTGSTGSAQGQKPEDSSKPQKG